MSTPTEGEQAYGYDDEITLKELILKIQEYWAILWDKKLWIIVAGLIGGFALGTEAYFEPDIYPATITFMVNEDNGGGIGGAAAILGQFGFGGGAASEYNLDKIVALAKSNKIVGAALLDDRYDPLLVDRLIETYEVNEAWRKDSLLQNFRFVNAKQGLAFNKALQYCINKITGNENLEGITVLDYEEETGILKLTVKAINARLSLALTESIYDKLANFYIQEKTEKPKQNFRLLKERADSVALELAQVEASLARIEDGERGLLLRSDKIKINQLQRNASLLTLMYGEIIKNKETAHFILKSETPFFQIVDQSVLPLSAIPKGIIRQIVIGGFIGVFLMVLIVLGNSLYTQTMK